MADRILGAENENIFPGILLEAPSSLPPASGQILLPALRHPPRDGVNSVTGLPFGARIFPHPDAYPMMSGENMTYIKKFNDKFPVPRVRFERLPGLCVMVWVEVNRGLAATQRIWKPGMLACRGLSIILVPQITKCYPTS